MWHSHKCRHDAHSIQKLATEEDPPTFFTLLILSVAMLASTVAMIWELSGWSESFHARSLIAIYAHYFLTALTLMGSWLLIGFVFTLHYAHLYYQSPVDQRPLKFLLTRNERESTSLAATSPNYWEIGRAHV